MLKPKKIIHLTDLHHGSTKLNIDCTATLEYVKAWIFQECKPRSDYVIVITGDLVDDANETSQWETSINFITALAKGCNPPSAKLSDECFASILL